MINLCKCNNCDSILIDKNPQINAKEYDEKSDDVIKASEMIQLDDDGYYWACPVCMTDEFLDDL